MALQLEKELDNGVSGDYWKIINISLSNKRLDISIGLYVDKVTRDGGKKPLDVILKSFIIGEKPEDSTDNYITNVEVLAEECIYHVAYSRLKEDMDFEGSIDLL